MQHISSPDNPKLRYLQRLQDSRAFRQAEGRTVLEGLRLIEAALDAGARPRLALVSAALATGRPAPGGATVDGATVDRTTGKDPTGDGATDDAAPGDSATRTRAAALLARLEATGALLLSTTAPLFRQTAGTQHPQGLLAAVDLAGPPPPSAPQLVLVLDAWRDPGNLGTALRAAAAAGVDLAVLGAGTVDPWHPRALRSGMGAQFLLPMLMAAPGSLAEHLAGLDLCIADAGGELDHVAMDWSRPTAILVGGEAEGPSAEALALPHRRLRIAMAGGIESLNAATAAAILVFAARRQGPPQRLPQSSPGRQPSTRARRP